MMLACEWNDNSRLRRGAGAGEHVTRELEHVSCHILYYVVYRTVIGIGYAYGHVCICKCILHVR
jgi:hypothetical protein